MTTTENKQITSNVLTALDSYEKHLDNASSCINDVSVNVHLAIKSGMITQPNWSKSKTPDSKAINDYAMQFAQDVLSLTDWKKVSSAKKACLRRAIPVGVAISMKDCLATMKKKHISPTGKIWIDSNKANLDVSLNKDGGDTVALSFKDADKWAKNTINYKENADTSSALELAIAKVIAELDKCYDQNGLIDLPNAKCRSKIDVLFNKVRDFKAELNAQAIPSKDEMTAKNINFSNPNVSKAVNQ